MYQELDASTQMSQDPAVSQPLAADPILFLLVCGKVLGTRSSASETLTKALTPPGLTSDSV